MFHHSVPIQKGRKAVKFLDLILITSGFTNFNSSLGPSPGLRRGTRTIQSPTKICSTSPSLSISIFLPPHTLVPYQLINSNSIQTEVLHVLNTAQCICAFSELFTFPQVIQKPVYLENVSSGGYFTCLPSVRSSGEDMLFSPHLSLLIA